MRFIGEGGTDVGGLKREWLSGLGVELSEGRVGEVVKSANGREGVGVGREWVVPRQREEEREREEEGEREGERERERGGGVDWSLLVD